MLRPLTDPRLAGQSTGKVTEGVGRVLVLGLGAWLAWRYLISPGEFVPGDFRLYLLAWERMGAGLTPYWTAGAPAFQHSPGALALVGLLPSDPLKAWQVFGALSVGAWVGALGFGTRIRDLRSMGLLVLGLIFSWQGVLDALNHGQPDLLLLGLATFAAGSFEHYPGLSGLLLGFLPVFNLPLAWIGLPFVLIAKLEARHRRDHRFKRFFTGYFLGSFSWFCVLPSLSFGPDAVTRLSREWIAQLSWEGYPSGLALVGMLTLAAATFWHLVIRVRTFPGRRVVRVQSLGWIAPWLLFAQCLSPLTARWGSVFAIGIPFSYERSRRGAGSAERWVRNAALLAALVLWILQNRAGWIDAQGGALAYWLALIWMS